MLDKWQQAFSGKDHDLMVVEGRWCVEALLTSRRIRPVVVVRAEDSHTDLDPVDCELQVVPKAVLAEMTGYAFHRGVLALAERPAPLSAAAERPAGLLVACPELADAANLGTIARSAAALGASGMLVDSSGAEIFSRKAIRASSGAVFRLPIYHSPTSAMDEVVALQAHGYQVLGAALGADSVPLEQVEADVQRGVVVYGPEQGGLSEGWKSRCDRLFQIEMQAGMDSLNVSASAAISLYRLLQCR